MFASTNHIIYAHIELLSTFALQILIVNLSMTQKSMFMDETIMIIALIEITELIWIHIKTQNTWILYMNFSSDKLNSIASWEDMNMILKLHSEFHDFKLLLVWYFF